MNEHLDFRWMHGQHIADVSETSSVFWQFRLSSSGSITAESLWRLIRDGRIAVTGEDHGQQFGLPAPVDAASRVLSILAGATIQRVEIRDGTADLIIHFDHSFRLEVLSSSSGYESWQIYEPDGGCVVAQGGGQLCYAPPVGESRITAGIPIR